MIAFSGGNPERSLTKDEMLDDITLYWLTNSATSSAQLLTEGGTARPFIERIRIGDSFASKQGQARRCASGYSGFQRMIIFACEQNLTLYDAPDMEHRLVYLLNVGQRRLHRWSQARTAAGGVTSAQAGLLFFLGSNDGALTSEAAAALDLGAPGMSGLAERTERAGLIERRPDENDGRASRCG